MQLIFAFGSAFVNRLAESFGETHCMLFSFQVPNFIKIDKCQKFDNLLSPPVAMGYNRLNSKIIGSVPRVFESILHNFKAFPLFQFFLNRIHNVCFLKIDFSH